MNLYFQKILYGEGDSPLLIFHTGEDSVFLRLICAIYLEYQNRDAFWQGAVISLLDFIFVHLLRLHQEHVTTSKNLERPEHILSILQYIQEHYTDITLEELASRFGYTPAYLSRYIRKKTGMTFSQIVMRQKMEHACILLTTTRKSIRQISEDINCSDASYFSRQFLRLYGICPAAYRKNPDARPAFAKTDM